MRSGTKSIIEGLKFLEALHSQILNVPDANHQQLEVYGMMCPRWAASSELTDAEARTLMVDVLRRRAMQSVPVKDAIKILRELLKEQEMAMSIPASALEDGVHWTEVGDACSKTNCSCASRRRDRIKNAKSSWCCAQPHAESELCPGCCAHDRTMDGGCPKCGDPSF